MKLHQLWKKKDTIKITCLFEKEEKNKISCTNVK